MCVVESVTRLLPGFMGHESSGEDESFSRGLLEYPHYTRPESFAGERTPPALLSGDHGRIALWRRQAALKRTLDRRPELLSTAPLDQDDRAFLRAARRRGLGRNLFCALLHYPVLDRDQNSVAVSLTNLDIHDIARSSCTYGLAGYYVLTPLDDQRELLADIVDHWLRGPGGKANPDRKTALSLVRGGTGLDDAVADVKARTGEGPLLVGTSAVAPSKGTPVQDFGAVSRALDERPVLLLFGTGNGLAPEVVERCDAMLPPLRPLAGYNHLSVRSAAAIVFDRILNDWR
jgi:tRNA (guanine37-N1)-methyltransferase